VVSDRTQPKSSPLNSFVWSSEAEKEKNFIAVKSFLTEL